MTFEQSNRIREITPNFYKIEEGDNQVRINGARMDMYLDASSIEDSDEDEYIAACYSGMFFIKSMNEETGEVLPFVNIEEVLIQYGWNVFSSIVRV